MAPAGAGLGAAERFMMSALRVLNNVFTAVGDGIRAHKDFNGHVGRGIDPVEAVAVAVRGMDHH
jgi:hypothetical protein